MMPRVSIRPADGPPTFSIGMEILNGAAEVISGVTPIRGTPPSSLVATGTVIGGAVPGDAELDSVVPAGLDRSSLIIVSAVSDLAPRRWTTITSPGLSLPSAGDPAATSFTATSGG